ncbi:LPXTG cell wall anchor domain-containing protein [Brachybacterium sp. UMB0905]|uniref:LPXTG cell wall anchor domain-containing protein n=1 Tax=Brachybacterium sp. UMB0905 TaxID=2069310 RepID=UPI000C7F8F60|nr:LPXTG cell wall anchor domain-containing protein [Brachybacterium sp. UMB0905]PMC76338.1 hypothetical protein CJ197_04040 [Brachybacterium sp. UMB0905]
MTVTVAGEKEPPAPKDPDSKKPAPGQPTPGQPAPGGSGSTQTPAHPGKPSGPLARTGVEAAGLAGLAAALLAGGAALVSRRRRDTEQE